MQTPAFEPKWEENGPRRYASELTIEGVPMHLEAIPVSEYESEQTADESGDLYDALRVWNACGEPFVTATIKGREWLLIATPHCD